MTPDEREFFEMQWRLARSVRMSRRSAPGLARIAADWETELDAQLRAPRLMVAEGGEQAPGKSTGTEGPR